MIPKEILKKVRQIQIRTDKIVTSMVAGGYKSAFKGRGIEFEEVRQYYPGDEIRTIDWNVTARTNELHVKNYREERELTVMLLIDMSSSGQFGTSTQSKINVAAELCAVLAFSAIKSNDKVGLIMFTDKIELYLPPKKGKRHVLRVIRELLSFKPEKGLTDINLALEYLNKVQKRKTICFLVSDFIASEYEKNLLLTSKRHDVIAVSINDPREVSFPSIGLLEVEDEETGEIILIDTNYLNIDKNYEKVSQKDIEDKKQLFISMGIDTIQIDTHKPYIQDLVNFFSLRERRI